MDSFYMDNIDRLKGLIDRYDPAAGKPRLTRAEGARKTRPNPDMVVSARVRPLTADDVAQGLPEAAILREAGEHGVAEIDTHDLRRLPLGPPTLKSSTYTVDQAFGTDAKTEDIYDSLVHPLVKWAWEGGIGTLFAYGQTGSGKTFTVSGIEELVAGTLMGDTLDGERNVHLSIIELAGNKARDLLNERHPVSILEDSFGVTQLAGAVEHHVTTLDEVLGYIETAASFRNTEATEKNDTSSRSHAICRFRLAVPKLRGGRSQGPAEDGMLYLIDLAGSEAARDVANHGEDRLRETRDINKSLSVLKDCIRGKAKADAMQDNNNNNDKSKQDGSSGRGSKAAAAASAAAVAATKPYVPFRQSALTRVLKHVFDPQSARAVTKAVVIACVSPHILDAGPTRNTLRYAEMLRVLVPRSEAPRCEEGVPMTWTNEYARKWIDQESGTPPISSEILAPVESGMKLLRMPAAEFELRCLKSEGVTLMQAQAFRAKLWHKHVDSQKAPSAGNASAGGAAASEEDVGVDPIPGHLVVTESKSSRETNGATAKLPFKQRLRPGMVVRTSEPEGHLLMLLCPADAVGPHVRNALGMSIADGVGGQGEKSQAATRYLCARVARGELGGLYVLHMWRQVVMDVASMEAEMVLDYERGSRYYFLSV